MPRKHNFVEAENRKITLTKHEILCLNNIKKAGLFRSDSHTIGEVLRFVQALRDDSPRLAALTVLGPRFGIAVNPIVAKVVMKKSNARITKCAVCETEVSVKAGEIPLCDKPECRREFIKVFGMFCQAVDEELGNDADGFFYNDKLIRYKHIEEDIKKAEE